MGGRRPCCTWPCCRPPTDAESGRQGLGTRTLGRPPIVVSAEARGDGREPPLKEHRSQRRSLFAAKGLRCSMLAMPTTPRRALHTRSAITYYRCESRRESRHGRRSRPPVWIGAFALLATVLRRPSGQKTTAPRAAGPSRREIHGKRRGLGSTLIAWLGVLATVVAAAIVVAMLLPLPTGGAKQASSSRKSATRRSSSIAVAPASSRTSQRTARPLRTSASAASLGSSATEEGQSDPELRRQQTQRAPAGVVPTAAGIRKAEAWLAQRTGFLSMAVIDSSGHLHGWNDTRLFISASVPKAMMMVAYLRSHPTITADMQSVITKMIEYSDNDCADIVYAAIGGDDALEQVAQLAHMTHFSADVGFWGNCSIDAADQARFFYRMDKLIPKGHRAFARSILSHVVRFPYGIPQVARPQGWKVFFKGGWRTGLHGPWLIHQVARLERGRATIAIAILTDGELTDDYGEQTLAGVTQRLLGN